MKKPARTQTRQSVQPDELRPVVTDWDSEDPKVSLTKRGSRRLCRKTAVTGIVAVEDDPDCELTPDELAALEAHIQSRLRQGKEVRLFGGIRLYPCTDAKDSTKLIVCAQTMGFLRTGLLADKHPRFFRGGDEIDADELDALDREARCKPGKSKMKAVTPDPIVTCPDCGSTFRVGQQLG